LLNSDTRVTLKHNAKNASDRVCQSGIGRLTFTLVFVEVHREISTVVKIGLDID